MSKDLHFTTHYTRSHIHYST